MSLELENINNNTIYQNKTLLEKLQKSRQANICLYNIHVKQQTFNKSKHQEKWEQDLNNNEINWPNVYKNIYTSTIDNTFRNLQYYFLIESFNKV